MSPLGYALANYNVADALVLLRCVLDWRDCRVLVHAVAFDMRSIPTSAPA